MTSSFDDRARTWDDEAKTERAKSVAGTIVAATSPTSATCLMEYGAGTGLVAQFLAPRVGSVTLADPSEGMREVAAEKVASGVFPTGTRIWDLDLDVTDAPGDRFDLIVSVLALHHVRDLPTVLARLGTMLAPGGQLAIVDLEADGGAFHADTVNEHDGGHGNSAHEGGHRGGHEGHAHHHGDSAREGGHDADHDHNDEDGPHGFDEEMLNAALAPSGLRAAYQHGVYQLEKEGRPFPLFLAVCTRP